MKKSAAQVCAFVTMSLVSLALAAADPAPRVVIVAHADQVVEDGVLIVKPDSLITLKFAPGFAKKKFLWGQVRRVVEASATTYDMRAPHESIAAQTHLSQHYFFSEFRGANDFADPMLFVDDSDRTNSASFTAVDDDDDAKIHTWFGVNNDGEVTVKIASNETFHGEKDLYLNFASPSLDQVSFYMRKGDDPENLRFDLINRENLTTVKPKTKARLFETALRPSQFIKIKIRN